MIDTTGPALHQALELAAIGRGDHVTLILARRHRLQCGCPELTWCGSADRQPITGDERRASVALVDRLLAARQVYRRGGGISLTRQGRAALRRSVPDHPQWIGDPIQTASIRGLSSTHSGATPRRGDGEPRRRVRRLASLSAPDQAERAEGRTA